MVDANMTSGLRDRIEAVSRRIRAAAQSCGRHAGDIRLVTVSKTMDTDTVRQAIEGGAAVLGENYIQEARDKINALSTYPVSWHFIGHLQTNKARIAVGLFDLIHSVDSLRLALELNRQAERIDKTQKVLIQVNVGNEPSKFGVSPVEATQLVRDLSRLGNLSIEGLMTMPPFFEDPERARPHFAALQRLADRITSYAIPNASMEEISMGMTADFEVAIAEGATLVRVGTAIFGERR